VKCERWLTNVGAICGTVYHYQVQEPAPAPQPAPQPAPDLWVSSREAYNATQAAKDAEARRERERQQELDDALREFLKLMAAAGNPGLKQIHLYSTSTHAEQIPMHPKRWFRRDEHESPQHRVIYRERVNIVFDAWAPEEPTPSRLQSMPLATALTPDGIGYVITYGGRDDVKDRGNIWLIVANVPDGWDGTGDLPRESYYSGGWLPQWFYPLLREQGAIH
jgi:hypothetical protein